MEVGTRFGHLTILGKDIEKSKNKGRKTYYICQCDCGNIKSCRGDVLKSGKNKTCGCRYVDIVGQKFNMLTAIKFAGIKRDLTQYLFKCDCGNLKVLPTTRVTNGYIKSCGCHQGAKTHGMRNTRLYNIWSGIKQRCDCPTSTNYERYGGRGITYDPRWESFECFYEDMGESYHKHVTEHGEDNTTIDRIDFNGNYYKENCRWRNPTEQANNRRSNLYYQDKSMADWCRELGLKYSTVNSKVQRGMPLEEALGLI